MARFEEKEFSFSDINNGERYQNGDIVDADAINKPIEASYYAQEKAKAAEVKADEALNKVNDSAHGNVTLSAYPIGIIVSFAIDVNPAQLFGGSWEKIEGKFLLGSSSLYPLGSEGGSATHTLTVEEMPSHYHDGIKNPNNYHIVGSVGSGVSGRTTSSLDYVENYGSMITENAGGGKPHSIMPPYKVVNMWHRYA
jgi:hypothetical protein